MEKEFAKTFAYIGLALIVVSIVIGIWIGMENRSIQENYDSGDGDDLEDAQEAEERISFFYNRNAVGNRSFDPEESSPPDIDMLYPANPTPGHSGFNFFLLMGGITFVLFAYYISISGDGKLSKNLATLGILVMLASLLLAAWVSFMQSEITKESNDEIPDLEEIDEKFESIIVIQYMNAAVIFLGPALILVSLFKERVKAPKRVHNVLLMAGLALLILSIVLALVSGMNTLEITEDAKDGEIEDMADSFKTKAFISHFFPYLSFLALGMTLLPLVLAHLNTKSSNGGAFTMSIIGITCIMAGALLSLHPALQYHNLADEYESMVTEDSNGDELLSYTLERSDYFESTAFCYYAISIVFLGFGLIAFSMVMGQYSESGTFSGMQIMNLVFFLPIVLGTCLGFYIGNLKSNPNLGDAVDIFTIEYLYMILLLASPGLMFFSWTFCQDLQGDVQNLCPKCGEKVKFNAYLKSWFCEHCLEMVDKPDQKKKESEESDEKEKESEESDQKEKESEESDEKEKESEESDEKEKESEESDHKEEETE